MAILIFFSSATPSWAQPASAPNFTRRIPGPPQPTQSAIAARFNQASDLFRGFDGRFVVFTQPGTGAAQIWRATRPPDANNPAAPLLCSVFDGTSNEATSNCSQPFISEDGNVVVFYTQAALVSSDTNGKDDAYARVINDGTGTSRTLLVSAKRDSSGNFLAAADGDSQNPNISGDGLTIAYQSKATNLLPTGSDANGAKSDIFVASLSIGATNPLGPNEIVSVNSLGQQSTSASFEGFIASSLASHTPRYITENGMGVVFHGRPCDWTFALCPARDDSISANRCPGSCSSSTPNQVYFRDRASHHIPR